MTLIHERIAAKSTGEEIAEVRSLNQHGGYARMSADNEVEIEEEAVFFDDRCPKRQEAAQKSANTRAYDDVPTRRNMSLGQRLALGFEMMSDDGDYFEDADDKEKKKRW